ncbi:MAG: tRNA pseudouridine(55) synthase, partial [Lentisphaerae bacterium]|nr:tRNA pseudouridine(55) synthase [Lentisphaerota bacterium]
MKPRPRSGLLLNGVLLVDKPAGVTSHDVVHKIRRNFRLPKVGHGGTLDPQATGLLIIMIGKGTKLSSRIMGTDKVYEGSMHLGVTTDTQDGDGEILEEKDFSHVTEEDVLREMNALKGDQMQI